MKFKSTLSKLTVLLLAGLISMHPTGAFASSSSELPAKKKRKERSGTIASLNNNAVRIYPDMIKREMHVIAKNNHGEKIDFFVFDLEGTLKHHFKLAPRGHEKISDLEKGTYIFRIFSGDEEQATGKFEIR